MSAAQKSSYARSTNVKSRAGHSVKLRAEFKPLLSAVTLSFEFKRYETLPSIFVWLVSLHPRRQLGYITDGSQDWRLRVLRAAIHLQ